MSAIFHSTCAISIIRIQTLRVAAETQDPTYDNAPAAYWSFLELIIGVIAACLPTLRPIFVKLMPRLFGAGGTLGTGSGRPSRATYGAHGYVLPKGGSSAAGWSRSGGKTALSSPATLGGSDSAEELHANVGGMGQRPSDVEYGLQDLGRVGDTDKGDYRVHVSGGPPSSPVATSDYARRVLSKSDRGRDGMGWGIKATTMITQQVETDDGGGRRKIGA
jgi:hypothetical protein